MKYIILNHTWVEKEKLLHNAHCVYVKLIGIEIMSIVFFRCSAFRHSYINTPKVRLDRDSVYDLTSLLSICLTLDKLLRFSGCQQICLQKRHNNIYFIELHKLNE